MTNFIIFDSDTKRRELYTKVIKRFLFTSMDYYNIYEFGGLDVAKDSIEHLGGTKIYLINIDDEGGLVFSKKIRTSGDYISPVILFTSKSREKVIVNLRNVLFLDVIEIADSLVKELMKSLIVSYIIVTRHSVYTFTSFDELYRLPYNDIFYIQKNLNDDSVTIYTGDDTYLNYVTIKKVEEQLKDCRFFKVHRSCIINLYNVSSFDRKSNTIIFKNGMKINLVSRYNKPKLIERLNDYGETELQSVL